MHLNLRFILHHFWMIKKFYITKVRVFSCLGYWLILFHILFLHTHLLCFSMLLCAFYNCYFLCCNKYLIKQLNYTFTRKYKIFSDLNFLKITLHWIFYIQCFLHSSEFFPSQYMSRSEIKGAVLLNLTSKKDMCYFLLYPFAHVEFFLLF